MKTRNSTITILTLLCAGALLAALFFSCAFPQVGGNNGNLVINLSGSGSSRAVGDLIDPNTAAKISYRVECTGPGNVSRTFRYGSSISMSLMAGTWDITVKVLNLYGVDITMPSSSYTDNTRHSVIIEEGKTTTVEGMKIAIDETRLDEGAGGGGPGPVNQTPVADDYTFGNMVQYVGSVTGVTITPKAGKSSGARTILYNGGALPTTAGIYPVTFNVAAAAGWDAASGLIAGTLTIVDPAATTSNIFQVPSKSTWAAAVSAITTAGAGDYAIVLDGNITVSGTTSATFGTGTGINVTITGSQILNLSGQGSLLRISPNQQNVILQDVKLVGINSNNTSLVMVGGASLTMSSLTMNGSASISGNTNTTYTGGGVGVYPGGTFIMNGGTISGNAGSHAGGVYVVNNVLNASSIFIMNGGTISGNTAGYGGGVYVEGSFHLKSGTVVGSTAYNGLLPNTAQYGAALGVGGGTADYGISQKPFGTGNYGIDKTITGAGEQGVHW